MDFRTWFELNEESQITDGSQLPPIPPDCVRATNFTNPTVGPKLLAGQPFLYGRGMITSTTDAFSNNNEVWSLLSTGKTGAWDRNSFGNQVVLLDVPFQEYRQHSNPSMANGKLDNSRILGVFDRATGVLHRNPMYSPQKQVEPLQPPVKRGFPGDSNISQMPPTPRPSPTQPQAPTSPSSDSEDVW